MHFNGRGGDGGRGDTEAKDDIRSAMSGHLDVGLAGGREDETRASARSGTTATRRTRSTSSKCEP